MSRARETVFLIVGVTTPVGILVVNGSAFVMRNLVEFRTLLAACALISSLLLNGLSAWWIVNRAARTTPDLYAEYRIWVLGIAVVVVLATSAGGAYFTFRGMSDPKRLPDATAVITSVLALAIPFAFAFVARQITSRRMEVKRRRPQRAT
jgi:hypothetical protein